MSRLEELVNELCPDGVEYCLIGEIADVGTGSSNGNEAEDEGLYPFFIRSQTVKRKNSFEYDEEAIIIPGEGGIGDIYHYINGKYALHQRVYRIHFHSGTIDTKYAYYCFSNNFKPFIMQKAVDATVKSIRKPMIEQFEVPVPPLEVQQEIVRILDKFTQLKAELSAELSARRIQYEHYRNELLTFGDDVPLKSIGEICSVSAGGDAPKDAMSKKKEEGFEIPIVSNGIGDNALYGYTNMAKITEPAVTVAARGTIGYAEYRDYPYYPIIRLLTVMPKNNKEVHTKYLYYCLAGKEYSIPQGGIPQLTAPMLKKELIPIPSIDKQKEIIRILDRFNCITTDIYSGIPAEIEARTKQYEFYRDKLLSFKRKEVS